MTHRLSHKNCAACNGDVPALRGKELQELSKQLNPDWKIVGEKKIEREFTFPDFKTALHFTNKVGEIAEKEGHHPDIYLGWGKVKIVLWTHKIDGLSERDFILAAKCDEIPRKP